MANGFVNLMQVEPRLRDNLGRMKMSMHQNIYEADFEYGTQPLRWESYTQGSGTITHQPGYGGVAMTVTSATGDLTVRQSRPYHRYQPGKTMYMATNINFGTAAVNQRQRVGFFDDSNGIFIEQGDPTGSNPYGMFVVVRTDVQPLLSGTTNKVPTDTRISIEQWNGDRQAINSIDWTRVQMIWMEYAWYGAGSLRWGVMLNGEPYVLHQIGTGNGNYTGSPQQYPWSRTGNLPVRYEQRNLGSAAANTMYHYGVSVLVEGRVDDQRGFTYSYGQPITAPQRSVGASAQRFPLMSVQANTLAKLEFGTYATPITVTAYTQGNATTPATITSAGIPSPATTNLVGRHVFVPPTTLGANVSGIGTGAGATARIVAQSTGSISVVDLVTGSGILTKSGGTVVTPVAAQTLMLGLINRGLILPRQIVVTSTGVATVEIFLGNPLSPITLTGASFQPMSFLGSSNSLASRDVSATAFTGGEAVMAFPIQGGSSAQVLDLSNLFPLYNTIQGSYPDILTVAVSTPATAITMGCNIIAQEQMS